ncbi:MAG: ABC transporter ATP-binding protein [Pigmentiphaga sp.]|uniref:ABC transporter ATP-binding protein n=1 Tax=Pigmentiphaga sp. TaxID=1977564 RepID=UPI0029BC7027|nr:ABC transporter ATP-binding protein [Pigmentiphaga sp.]MDX3905579.1 ABC transporter ATP-binding protein [Pigmentiphaga sp.]
MSGIEIEKLVKSYGTVQAVKAIDLTVQQGEFLTLLGPSGSGKTTTLRMIAGLEKPSSGTIRIDGRVVNDATTHVPPHQRNMGMVFQSYAVWPHKSVYDNVAFPLAMRKMPRAEQRPRVNRLLDMVGLPSGDFGKRYPSQLSGGQQQRVALARALVGDPKVLLYDEPLSNLDARLRDSMRTLMRSIHEQLNVTSVYVTHDQIEAMVLSDRVCVMRDGGIVQQGKPPDLYERPNDPFVAEFIGQANVLRIAASDRASGTVRLGADLSLRVLPENWRGRNGQAGQLIVRYHQVKLLPSAAQQGQSNVFTGTVRNVMYLGDRLRYGIDIGSGSQLVGEVVTGDSLPIAGERVHVELPAAHCIVI